MPRYYKDWIYHPDERQSIADHLVDETRKRSAQVEAKLQKKYGDNWRSYLRQSQVATSLKLEQDALKRKDL